MNITCIIPSACTITTLPLLKRCIESLDKAKTKKIHLYIVVVTDNEDARAALLETPIHNFFLVRPDAGFSDRNNIGIEETISLIPSDYYLLINDDAWVGENFFQEFFRDTIKNKIDIMNPIIYKNNTQIIDSFGVEYFSSGYAKNAINTTTHTTLATAACMLISTKFLTRMKNIYGYIFCPLIYYYLEDVEFSIRARGVGGKIMTSQSLVAYHKGSATSGFKSAFTMEQTYKHVLWIYILCWPIKNIATHIGDIFLVQLWIIFMSYIKTSPFLYPKILWDTYIHFPEIYKYRKHTIARYQKTFNFSSLLSSYRFRTGKGVAF